jgi:Glycosyltransferase family 87
MLGHILLQAVDQQSILASHRRYFAVLGWLCAALLLLLFIWRTVLPATQQKTYAFSVYYTAARLTVQGQAGVRFCDEWFFDQQRGLGFGERADYFCPNPPTNALVLLPVAWLPPQPAQAAWIICDLVMLGGIVALGWRMVVLAPRDSELAGARQSAAVWFALVAALIIAFFRPLHAELHAVQVYTLIALLYALWLYGYLTRRDWLCGAALALLVLTKLSGWPLWLLMLAARRWRALAWALGIGVTIGLATLPWLTFEFWRLYLFEQVPAISLNPTHAVPANQTLTSLLRQCFTYDPEWAPRPLIDAPWLANVIWWLVALALLAPTLVYAYRHERMARQETGDGRQETGDGRQETGDAGLWSLVSGLWSPTLRPSTTRFAIDRFALAMLCLVMPLQPAGEEYHYTLLLIVLLVVCNRPVLASLGSRTAAVGLALAWLLLALPSYFLQTAQWQGWPIALLAYPRVYGALLLWGILVRIEDRGSRIEDSTMLQ